LTIYLTRLRTLKTSPRKARSISISWGGCCNCLWRTALSCLLRLRLVDVIKQKHKASDIVEGELAPLCQRGGCCPR
jgi:hypothetical protein